MSHSSSHRTEWAGRVEEDGVSSWSDNVRRRIKRVRESFNLEPVGWRRTWEGLVRKGWKVGRGILITENEQNMTERKTEAKMKEALFTLSVIVIQVTLTSLCHSVTFNHIWITYCRNELFYEFFIAIQDLRYFVKHRLYFAAEKLGSFSAACNVLPAHPECSWRSGDSSVMSRTTKSGPACMHLCLYLRALSLNKVCHDYIHNSVYLFTSLSFLVINFFWRPMGLVAWLDTEAELGWDACLSLLLLLFVGFLMLPFAFIFHWVLAEKMNMLACFSITRFQLMKCLQ